MITLVNKRVLSAGENTMGFWGKLLGIDTTSEYEKARLEEACVDPELTKHAGRVLAASKQRRNGHKFTDHDGSKWVFREHYAMGHGDCDGNYGLKASMQHDHSKAWYRFYDSCVTGGLCRDSYFKQYGNKFDFEHGTNSLHFSEVPLVMRDRYQSAIRAAGEELVEGSK